MYVVAHGRVVASSCQVTDVKQHQAQLGTWMGDLCLSHAASHIEVLDKT